VAAGVVGLVALAEREVAGRSPADRLVILGVALAVGLVLAVVAWTVPGRRMLPYWGWIGDVLHTLAAVSLIPLTLQVVGVYGRLRGMNG
jgi:hypothetical protein